MGILQVVVLWIGLSMALVFPPGQKKQEPRPVVDPSPLSILPGPRELAPRLVVDPCRLSLPLLASSHANTGSLLVLFPPSLEDTLLQKLQVELRRSHGDATADIILGDELVGPLDSDPGAWRQAATFARASLWFLLGRQCLKKRDFEGALQAFEKTRDVLGSGQLLSKARLLESMALLNAYLQWKSGALADAEQNFHRLALINPDDLSDEIPDSEAKALYQAKREWVRHAPRVLVRVQASMADVDLFVDGAEVIGRGPRWLIELPPGEHIFTAAGPGARPDSATLTLDPSSPTPDLALRPEPASVLEQMQCPFSLNEARWMLEQIRELIRHRGKDFMILQAATGAAIEVEGLRASLDTGARTRHHRRPGPDDGETSPAQMAANIDVFRIDARGEIAWLGMSRVGPLPAYNPQLEVATPGSR